MSYTTPPRYILPRYFYRKRLDGRIDVVEIRIKSFERQTILYQSGTIGRAPESYLVVSHENQALISKDITHKGKRVGKKKNARLLSAEEVCVTAYERIIQDKIKEGYREVASYDEALQRSAKRPLVHTLPLPNLLELDRYCPGFRPWKPKNVLKEKSPLWKLAMQGMSFFVRKMDGYGCILVKDSGEFKAYTLNARANMHPDGTLLERLPLVRMWIDVAGPLIPDGTMLLGEIVPDEEDMQAAGCYEYVASVLKQKVDGAVEAQDEDAYLGIYLWDILLWANHQVGRTEPYRNRIALLCDLVQSAESGKPTTGLAHALIHGANYSKKIVNAIDLLPTVPALIEPQLVSISSRCPDPISYVLELIRINEWEGVVVADPDAITPNHAWSMSSRPTRPSAFAKLKRFVEDDFIAVWDPDKGAGEWGVGKFAGLAGSVDLYQYKKNTPIYCGRCGVGFSHQMRKELVEEHKGKPFVIQVAFDGWTSKGKLVNPRYSRTRTDKATSDCHYSGPA